MSVYWPINFSLSMKNFILDQQQCSKVDCQGALRKYDGGEKVGWLVHYETSQLSSNHHQADVHHIYTIITQSIFSVCVTCPETGDGDTEACLQVYAALAYLCLPSHEYLTFGRCPWYSNGFTVSTHLPSRWPLVNLSRLGLPVVTYTHSRVSQFPHTHCKGNGRGKGLSE